MRIREIAPVHGQMSSLGGAPLKWDHALLINLYLKQMVACLSAIAESQLLLQIGT